MFDRRIVRIVTVVACLLGAGTLSASAEIYKYRDPETGRLIISNQPPPAGVGSVATRPSQGPGAAVGEAPVIRAPGVPGATDSVLKRRGPLSEAEWRWLEDGRVDYEVIARLGEPAERRLQQTFDRRGMIIQREIWVYPGDDAAPTVLVWMVEGRVRGFERQLVR